MVVLRMLASMDAYEIRLPAKLVQLNLSRSKLSHIRLAHKRGTSDDMNMEPESFLGKWAAQ